MFEGRDLLIQCIGNRLRRDDGAAPAVGDRLRAQGLGECVRDYWGEGTELMQDWEVARHVFMVDAAHSGATPGTIHRIDARVFPVPKNFCYYSTHRFGVAEAVELARALDRLPPSLRLFAIEGGCFDAGAGLTASVETAVNQVAEELRRLV